MGARARGSATGASDDQRAHKHADAVGGQQFAKSVCRRWGVGEVIAALEGHVQFLETKQSFLKGKGAWNKDLEGIV